MTAAELRDQVRGAVVPQPQPPLDPTRRPFVGNATVEENLAEAVQVALWNRLGEACHAVAVDVQPGGVIALEGELPQKVTAASVVEAVRNVNGVSAVIDRLTAPRRPDRGQGANGALAMDVVSVRRFCAADEPSTSAAIRQAVARLDAWCSEHDERPGQLIVIYRNLRQGTITLDIAMPTAVTAELPAGSELRREHLVLTPASQTDAEPGFAALLKAHQTLQEGAGRAPNGASIFWQVFDAAEFRPWRAHPSAPVHFGEATQK
jgi:hypothetical protein